MERRSHPRVPLDTPHFAELFFDADEHIKVLLVDVSQGGLQLAFSPGNMEPEEMLGLSVTVRELPPVLDPEKKGITEKIVWLAPQRCGVRFAQLLVVPEGEILELSESL